MPKVLTILDSNTSPIIVDVEAHLSNSLPNIVIVGFANKSVDEAKERIRGALASSNIKLPKKRITINLAPADIPKDGSYFDLPILVSILVAGELILKQQAPDDNIAVFGEVGLNGEVRPVRGIIGKILSAKKLGISSFWIPFSNLDQARLVPGVKLHSIKTVSELYEKLTKNDPILYESSANLSTEETKNEEAHKINIDDIIGQQVAKRATIIATAGHHNLLLNGPPGAGKSMLAKAIPSIMPPLTQEEILEITHIHSLANKNYDKIIKQRPFRSPHHSSSNTSILGGGQNPKPGEISLAHHGVLLFDEFPEFNRSVIESLRQPLEDKMISVSRAKESIEFPADFLLVATANPCPCGYFGSNKECSCSPIQIINYQRKSSGPILDRIDIYVDIEAIDHSELMASRTKTNNYEKVRKIVEKARKRQLERSGKLNSSLTNDELKRFAKMNKQTKALLDSASSQMQLSARAYIRTLRVARTIADLDNSDEVSIKHVTEALQYRKRTDPSL